MAAPVHLVAAAEPPRSRLRRLLESRRTKQALALAGLALPWLCAHLSHLVPRELCVLTGKLLLLLGS